MTVWTVCCDCQKPRTGMPGEYGRCCVCWIKRAERFEEALKQIAVGKIAADGDDPYFRMAGRFIEIAKDAIRHSPQPERSST